MAIAVPTGLINWTPTEDQISPPSYTVTIQVSDGVNATSTSYQVTVGLTGQTPETTIPAEAVPSLTTNEIQNFSTSTTTQTSTAAASAEAGNRIFAAALLVGIFENLVAFIRKYSHIIGYLLWLVTLGILIFFILFGKRKKDEGDRENDSENGVRELQDGTVEIVPEQSPFPLHASQASSPELG